MALATTDAVAIFVAQVSATPASNDGRDFLGTTACKKRCQRLTDLDSMALGAQHIGIGGGGGGGGGKDSCIDGGHRRWQWRKDGGNRQVEGLEATDRQEECGNPLCRWLELMYCCGSSCICDRSCHVKIGFECPWSLVSVGWRKVGHNRKVKLYT